MITVKVENRSLFLPDFAKKILANTAGNVYNNYYNYCIVSFIYNSCLRGDVLVSKEKEKKQ